MGYLEKTLSVGETVIHQAEFHWTYTLGAWLFLISGEIFALFIWFLLIAGAPDQVWVVFVLFGLFGYIFLRLMIAKWTTEIAVTNRRFLYKRGWIARRTHELPMRRVEEVNVDQGVFGRIFGFGKVRVSGTGGDKPISTPNVDDPLSLRKTLVETAEGIAVASRGDARGAR